MSLKHMITGCIGITFLWIFWPFVAVFYTGERIESVGEFGDLYGSFNALFSSLAFMILIYGVYQQNKALDQQQTSLLLQQKEFEESRLNFAEAAKSQIEQAKLLTQHIQMLSENMDREYQLEQFSVEPIFVIKMVHDGIYFQNVVCSVTSVQITFPEWERIGTDPVKEVAVWEKDVRRNWPLAVANLHGDEEIRIIYSNSLGNLRSQVFTRTGSGFDVSARHVGSDVLDFQEELNKQMKERIVENEKRRKEL